MPCLYLGEVLCHAGSIHFLESVASVQTAFLASRQQLAPQAKFLNFFGLISIPKRRFLRLFGSLHGLMWAENNSKQHKTTCLCTLSMGNFA